MFDSHLTPIVLAAALAAALGLSPASPVDAPPAVAASDTFTLELGSGMPIDRFLIAYTEVTGKRIIVDRRKTQNKTITGYGDMTFAKADADAVFQSLLIMQDFAMVSIGPEHLGLYLLEDIRTSQFLKQRARPIALSDLDQAMARPAEVVSVVIPLEHVSCDRAQRALANIIQEHRSGFVVPLIDTNSLLITNFGPTVKQMASILRSLDVEGTPMKQEEKGEEGR